MSVVAASTHVMQTTAERCNYCFIKVSLGFCERLIWKQLRVLNKHTTDCKKESQTIRISCILMKEICLRE